MNMISHESGIDVAKDELVVSIAGAKPFPLPNTEDGCRALAGRLPGGSTIHLEASGGYERLAQRMLGEAGFKVVLHNPLKPRRMAQAQGKRAKTDQVDAKVLSQTGHLLPETRRKSMARQQLADHSRVIETIREMASTLKRYRNMPELDNSARQLLEDAISDLRLRIVAAEKAIEERIRASAYVSQYDYIRSVPALGKTTARICICEFPEDLPERTPDEIASYAGLAPIDDRSGKRTGHARLGHGNARLKKAFYMPAICAVRSQPWARTLYARLRSNGRGHQAALVAVMRRLIVRAVAVLKRGSPWEVEPSLT